MNFRKPQTQDSEEEKAPMLEAHIPDPATFIRLPSQISKRNVVFVVQRIHGTRWMWSPANDHLTYKALTFDLDESRQPVKYFPAHPTEETEGAWADLFEKQNLALSPTIMQLLGREDQGIKLPDGNYFGTFTVFHHLHCLKTLYQQLHPDYFTKYRNVTGLQKDNQNWHNEHCFSMLKQGIMCQGDTTLLTMKWDANRALPIGNMSSQHECVDWSRLSEWSDPHSFNPSAKGWLVHPKLGPVFDDNGNWVNGFDPVLGSPPPER
ncbi:hypothetical protein NQ176_g2331 [Zarea fungicola]|uniref:Uncharacterized protein n=1 Tax=Zarea fungicola TaxID=93591 RepID=A0ACC1NPU7_9HYPO|nr:hypothetical protein NQ176_g2331 [Lecanicillium fungicola]